MAQSRHHYERAFERHLVESGRSFVSVNEVRRSLLPPGHRLELLEDRGGEPARESLKSFDFMLYGDGGGLLIDIKGRKFSTGAAHRARARAINNEATSPQGADADQHTTATDPDGATGSPKSTDEVTAAGGTGRLESWVTVDDLESLGLWRQLFGPGYRACFVFVYWCDALPPVGLFPELIWHEGRWYGVRGIELDDYVGAMRVRSARWRTVHLAREDYLRLSGPVLGERRDAGMPDGATDGAHVGVPGVTSGTPPARPEVTLPASSRDHPTPV